MNELNNTELLKLQDLANRIRSGLATAIDMRDFLGLIQKSGQNNWAELQHYLNVAGYANVDQFKQALDTKATQEVRDGLAQIAGAIILFYALSKLFKK